MAVGDTASDLEMLRLAKLSFAPGNAAAAVKSASGVTVVRPAAEAGFSVAVARLIGHRSRSVRGVCPASSRSSSRLLLDLLAVENLSRIRQAVRAARLLRASRGLADRMPLNSQTLACFTWSRFLSFATVKRGSAAVPRPHPAAEGRRVW